MRRANDWAQRRTALTAVVGGVVTLAAVALPSARFAYRSDGAHLVLETGVSMVAGLVALLMYGRYRRSTALNDLLLAYALALVAMTALLFVVLPRLVGEEPQGAANTWAALVVRLAAAVLFLTAALLPQRVHRVGHVARDVVGVALALAALGASTYLLSSRLPDAVQVMVLAETSSRPVLDGHPVVLAVQVLNLVCYAIAALVFTRRATRTDDDLLGWLGAGAALGAWARAVYLLYPSLYTDWLYLGDMLRLSMYLLLLFGAVQEIRRYWRAQAAVAVDAERRRLARDLHDGLVQELGYIRGEVRRGPVTASNERIAAAADRALDEARRAVHALVASPRERLADALRDAVSEVADRYDVPLDLALDSSVVVPPHMREELVRITREAVANAARHAGAPKVTVQLKPGLLVVEDAGCGFDTARGRPGGFGLTSMRERAEAINARLGVESTPGRGTRVAVTW